LDANLEIRNVGFLKGTAAFDFRSGRLNVVEAPNRLGKTTILKGLATVLALPSKTDLPNQIATRLGLLDSSGNTDPLINVGAIDASIGLSVNGDKRTCSLRIGKPLNISPRGDERFLLTGILSEESEITRKLRDGSGDFDWIVANLSLADKYEKASLVVEKELNESKLKLEEIEERTVHLRQVKERIQHSVKEKDEVSSRLEKIEARIARLPSKSPELEKNWGSLQIREREIRGHRDMLRKNIMSKKTEIATYKKRLDSLNAEINASKRELQKIEKKLAELPPKKEMEDWETEVRHVEVDEIPKVRENRARIEGYTSLFESAMSSLHARGTGTYEIKCPICGKPALKATGELKLHYEEMQRELSALNNKIASLTMRKNELLNRKKQLDEERTELEETRTTLRAQSSRKESELNRGSRDFEGLNKSLEPLLNEDGKLEKELAATENELKIIGQQRARLGADERQSFEERGETMQRLNMLEKEITKSQEELSDSSVERIEDKFVPIEALGQIYREWSQITQNTIDLLREEAGKQKREAAKRFNEKIKGLLWKLGFTDFEDVWLDEESYSLNILRKKGQRSQPPSSLSTSEKHALATLLQLAVKDAYMPENPFLIIDEVVLDFDRNRVDKIMGYLSELAKERDWFIIMTRLGDVEQLKVKYV
jgi:DNA repair exonuclease SbcCD ATPase subunit